MNALRLLVVAAFLFATWIPQGTRAQSAKVHKVAVLGVASPTSYARQIEALRQGLRELGYVEGKNLVLEFRWAGNDVSRLPGLAAELVGTNPDVIVTSGAGSAIAKRATGTIPIVMAVSTNAAENGLVASLARPGGNVTGSSSFAHELVVKRLELLKEALPRLERVGLLLHSRSSANRRLIEETRQAARSLRADLIVAEVGSDVDFGEVFAKLAKERADALIVADHTALVAEAAQITRLASLQRLPVAGFREIADNGGLMAYGVEFPALWRRAATYVDRILNGARPADLPVEQPMKFEFVLNLKTAKGFGVAIPKSTVLRADRVIE